MVDGYVAVYECGHGILVNISSILSGVFYEGYCITDVSYTGGKCPKCR